ncbi:MULTISPECIES: PIN domain-containing protein [unclassified Pseudomonas]|uniref:PIN domain-containing protein n=1 Tax=unclassified Pseudomonas TaxID=196821 RepID=UPI0011A0DB53|nr:MULTISPECIES: PIN domain-containing protein [unclassified Pseudomonas]TWC20675.1 hypothetical protein FBY05_10961 [Pseudomonas sp. SJZ083]TWC47370.1 hypothetical protein FBY01_10961 [Pseudomonas sp. SJZ077]
MTARKEADGEQSTFILEEVFPDAEGIFSARFQKLSDSYKNALFVFDTNVLLLPYSMRKEGLMQLRDLYKRLISDKRLFIPKRVAREFARNRNKKLAEIHHSLMQSKVGKNKNVLGYPILNGLDEKTKIDEALVELNKAEANYYKAIDALASTIRGWEWNDPVSAIYSELFTVEVLIEHKKNNSELIAELDRRFKLKIPPGYKDSGKDDGGVGDLSIWLSVLELGSSEKRDIIFVTEDIKPDWWNQSNGSEFLPRFELIDEYRRFSEGNTLHIIRLSKLLELFEVEKEFVEEAKEAEKNRKEAFLRVFNGFKEERKRKSIIFGKLTREEQLSEVRAWFYSNYEDPAESCPYESREGGYQFIWGGPYDAREEIDREFSDIASQSIIDEVVSELEGQCFEWSGCPEYQEDQL